MKTVIFLGAGASASEGAPMQNKLFYEYFKLIKNKNNSESSTMEQELSTFFQLMFNIDVDVSLDELLKIGFPTFEEALGILDLANTRNEAFKNYSNVNIASNSGRIRNLRLYLTLLMADAIHHNLFEPRGIHAKLVRNLQDADLLQDVSFVSTNYDILIDNALISLYPEVLIDYGIDFVNFNEPDSWDRPDDSNSVKLLKIHGSLNWLYCPTCSNIRLTPKQKGIIKLLDLKSYKNNQAICKRGCGTIYSPIIVPPTFYKDFTNLFLNQVWNKSEQMMLEAKHLIFCGYSFPDADMHIKYLIKRAQKNRRSDDLKISVINNHKGKKGVLKKEETDRFQRFLGKSVDYTKYSFEDFANKPQKILKNTLH